MIEIMGLRLGARAIAAIAAILLVVAFLLWGPAACRSYFTQKRTAEVAQGQAGAAINSGAEATSTLGNIMENGQATDAAVKEGNNAIHNASEADRGRVATDAACRLRAYRDLKRCAALRGSDPAADARPRPAH
jgi:hypothetical protein